MKKEGMVCPICGAALDMENEYRCSRFPICTYQMPRNTSFDTKKNAYIVFDLETTGLDRRSGRIIEIGAVKVQENQIVDTFSMLLNPGFTQNNLPIYISSRITEITGITNEELVDKPYEQEGVSKFLDWSSGYDILVGHNIDSFDIPFLKSACKRYADPFPYRYSVDTLKLAKQIGLQKKGAVINNKQPTLAKYLGFTYNAHRASDDAKACFKVLQGLSEIQNPVLLPIL